MKKIFLALAGALICIPALANEHVAVNITTAAPTKAICTVGAPGYVKVIATGTWGSGTLTLYETTDNGTTKIGINDLTGVATTLTADGATNDISVFTAVNKGKTKKIWGVLSGSTGATLSVYCQDSKG